MSLFCAIGLHDYIPCGAVDIVRPKRGPFDPRTDEERSWHQEMAICARCGKQTEYEYPDLQGI